MKKYISIFLLLLIFSCDDMGDYLSSLNVAPEISFDGQDEGILKDSLKYVEICDNCKRFDYTISDPNNDIKELTYNISLGDGIISQNGQPVSILDPGLSSFYYKPNSLGNHIIEVTVMDNFGESSKTKIELYVFENLRPVANLNLSLINEDIPLEYEFDAQKSFDGDQDYGGFILGYEYEIILPNKTQQLNTTSSKFNYTFPGTGEYEINLKVVDSDSVRSDVVKKTLVID